MRRWPPLRARAPATRSSSSSSAPVPFTPEQLLARYPTHDDYVAAVIESADAAVAARFLLADDRDRIIEEARAAAVPG